ncbi:hypothetical protein HZS92_01382 [Xanthomonas citri pv. citri]|nr:hypothetical protein HZS91_01425 [Xanthomonas citri pv. citri]QYF39320.1 hypothetical protein HZS92_01382 [Xanthomonas citri pv. citri]QYF44094.1 hypothetical protein HZS93_01383 [Xanthomonas citri]
MSSWKFRMVGRGLGIGESGIGNRESGIGEAWAAGRLGFCWQAGGAVPRSEGAPDQAGCAGRRGRPPAGAAIIGTRFPSAVLCACSSLLPNVSPAPWSACAAAAA